MEPGTKISHYEVLSPLGKGGMGEVWRARDTKLGREVAIKTLPEEFLRDSERLARLRREARTASALSHPNICVVFDLDESGSSPFIVMELLKGETLGAALARGPLPVDHTLDIATQIADGLDAAHGQGILHRDIKPANIFITERGVAKLLDFGLARMPGAGASDAPTVANVTGSGIVLGTVSYMSPEQARGEELDARSDLFSLGVVLYEMLTGRPAFSGPTSAAIFEQIFSKTVRLPVQLGPGVPKELGIVIDGMLEKNRSDRSSSARELRATISRIRRNAGLRSTESGSSEKSIVVLPFENLSPDPENEYFSDGLTDEIITDLSKIRGLRVISRTSSMQFKGSGQDPKAIAARLDVRYVLEGSVRKAGNAVRVTAQLIDPETNRHLWAEKYSGKLEDIFEIQEQISRKIVDALKIALSPEEDRKLAEREIEDVRALECYHRARYEIYKFTGEGLDRARELIETALKTAGDNELLYASLGALHWQYVNTAIKPDDGHIARAEELARNIFAMNPESAAGHALMGLVHQNRGRPQEAVRSFKKALSLDPHESYALGELARVYECVGACKEARKQAQEYLRRDPLSVITLCVLLYVAAVSGEVERAQEEGLRYLASVPHFPLMRFIVALAFVHDNKPGEAMRILKATAEATPTISGQLCRFMRLALAGQPQDAEACFDADLLARARNVEFWAVYVAELYALIDKKHQALDWLETAFHKGYWNYPYIARHSTIFRKLDGDPRFADLLVRMKTAFESFEP